VHLVAAVDPAGDPHQIADDIPVLHNVEQILAYGIDYAVVACPTSLHAPVGLKLAAAGIPALIEKPLAATVSAAARLAAAFTSAALPAAVGHVERFNPALQVLRSVLASGELGQIYQVTTRRQSPRPHRVADVGVLKDDLDTTSWLIGRPYVVLNAQTLRQPGNGTHEDLVALIGCLAGGTITSHLINWLSPSMCPASRSWFK
jgi:predicted dehydrogenase